MLNVFATWFVLDVLCNIRIAQAYTTFGITPTSFNTTTRTCILDKLILIMFHVAARIQ